MSLKNLFKNIDWKNPNWENYVESLKKTMANPKPVNIFPLYRKNKTENGHTLASFSSRMFAMTLDMIIILLIFGPVLQWISVSMFPELSTVAADQRIRAMLYATAQGELSPQRLFHELSAMGVFKRLLCDHMLQIAVSGCYAVFSWYRWQATPAMWLLRMQVVDAATYQSVPLKRLVWRYLVIVPSMFLLALGFFWIAFDKRRQGWHDKVASTLVVQKPFSSWWKKNQAEETAVVTQP